MDVLDVIENEDGSADVTIVLEPDELKYFVSYAVNGILKERINDGGIINNLGTTEG